MEAISAAVILLFVFSIFSGIKGDIPKDPASRSAQPARHVVDASSIPATFSASYDPGIKDAIDRFVRPRAKKVSVEEAEQISDAIMRYSEQYDVNPRIVTAMIFRESAFDPRAVSSSNAQGLAQLLPATAAYIGIKDPFDIDEGVKGAALYLKMKLDRWAGYPDQIKLALASYAEGPNQVARAGGAYSEKTAKYIDDILRECLVII
ncbi:MAG: transglycosylase SLT domain-containing protein [Candidatus ainarchaeum sp.]|nr:transglycosylase SLT domain-containing protein [Candidatus ainarchaeum sp.]